MARVLAAALLVTWVGSADAGPKRKVPIETEPAGALVYLGEVESGPVCEATPCSVTLPVGEQTLIIELAGHQRVYTSVIVPKRGKIKPSSFKLEKSVGTIVVEGPRGATVTVDDVDQGKAPVKIEVTAEAHRVVISMNARTLHEGYVEVGAGEELEVTVSRVAGGGGSDSDPDPDDDDAIDEQPDDDAGAVRAAVVARPARTKYLRVSAAIDVGFRQFSYVNVQTPNTLREESEAGQVLGGPVVELWPGAMAGVRALRGLSLLGRFQFNLNSQPVVGNGIMDETSTYWQSLEVSLRHHWQLGDTLGVEVGAGYAQDRHQFNGFPGDIRLLPDVNYQAMRLGARVSAKLGALEPYLTVENRFVFAAGKLEERFVRGDVTGLRGAIGVSAQLGKLSARVEARATRYSWEFDYMPTSEFRADSATDAIQQIQLAVGYEY